MNISEGSKTAYRRICRERLRGMTQAQMERAGTDIAAQVLASERFRAAQTVFAYVSMPSEPDTRMILSAALKAGKRVCVPRCRENGQMDAVRICAAEELMPGAYGIPEPHAEAPVIPPEEIDLAIIPCVGAATDGTRLGHGAGYYDRFLMRSGAYRMCLCYSALLFPALPAAEHDIRMDCVIADRSQGEEV